MPDLNQQLSDKRFLEQINKSIKKHDIDLLNKIQKRRGRKKFILSSDDGQHQDLSHFTYLTKRDQKYLGKVINKSDLNSSKKTGG
jgi:CRISPR/Cas system-associated protein Cas7 (RAMP superfamily)